MRMYWVWETELTPSPSVHFVTGFVDYGHLEEKVLQWGVLCELVCQRSG